MSTLYIYSTESNGVVARIHGDSEACLAKMVELGYADHSDFGATLAPAFGAIDGLTDSDDARDYDAVTHDIEIAFDSCGSEEGAAEFAEWLNTRGHTARVGKSTGSYIDGRWTARDHEAGEIMENLWESFCRG